MENPRGLTRCSVEPVARQSRPMLPVFGGISGSTRTTLKEVKYGSVGVMEYWIKAAPPLLHYSITPPFLEFARDKFLQFDNIRGKLPDTFRGLFGRHGIVVKKIPELLLVHLQSFDVRVLRFRGIEL